MNGHLEASTLGEVAQGLKPLDGDSRCLVTRAPVELDPKQSAQPTLRRSFQRGSDLIVKRRRHELPRTVAERSHHVSAALGRGAPARFLDQARHACADALALGDPHLGQLGERSNLVRGKQMPRRIHWMCREVETEGVALCRHPLRQCPGRVARQAHWRRFRRARPEQARLAAGPLLMRACGVGEDDFGSGEDGRSLRLDGVEGSSTCEALQLPAVQ